MRDAAAETDQFLRRTAIESIGRHPRGQALRTIILAALTDPSDYVARTGCKVVEDWAWAEAHDVVAALLRSPSHATRHAAIRTLGAIWQDTDFQPLFHIYTRDPERAVRREAAWTLREHVGTSDWLQLFDAFRTDDPPRHRVWACELAGTFGHSAFIPRLETLRSDRDGHVRTAAATAADALSRRELGQSAETSR
ncbi:MULTISPECIES: HEAT repeat domain-containing protein [unclassified Bradyrhizobium]|uniref:HEAT repeat domain-containing protein n=1 Tax=unclassified Bradyrhizobium TaxID=2631580 RepID=UPI0024E190D0|nr:MULTISPECIES: HEAT repeat domain-containing protein [unclassified Bradyrhizobium]